MNSTKMTNPFEVLGIDEDSSDAEVKKAYFQQVRQFAPETHAEQFKQIREAYDLLKDPSKRLEAEVFSFVNSKHETVVEEEALPPLKITADTLLDWLRHHHSELDQVDFTRDYTQVL